MRVKAEHFSAMRGHVGDGHEIVGGDGAVYTLHNRIRGWSIVDADGVAVAQCFNSAADIECYVVRFLTEDYTQ